MNQRLGGITVMAMLPLLAVALAAGHVNDASAARSEVCGIQLCSEIPGGWDAWMEQRSSGAPVAPPEEKDEEHMEEKHMEGGEHMEGGHMEEKHMEERTDGHMEDKQMQDGHMMEGMEDKHMMEDGSMMDKHDAKAGLKLARANVPATIPMNMGYYDGQPVHFIITDSSDPTHAEIITASQGWKVELAPLLKNAPESALSRTYMFVNGIEGGGVHGYQGEVFTSTPAQPEVYSALTGHVHVTWMADATPRILDSEAMIMEAEASGEVQLDELEVVLNMPHIMWPGGQMTVKEDKSVHDDTGYGGGQVIDIDTDEMTVTFIAHRGWGPDGRTIYYIVTDATPSGPAEAMGVISTPTSANLIANSAAVDLFQFSNGLAGTGPLGFQPGIASGGPGDANYSPMWRIFLAEWKDPYEARLLETVGDLNAYRDAGMLDVGIAQPMGSDHIVNCPFIDPFQ